MTKAEKRRHFFDQGVAALDAIGVDARGRYLCPLCLRWFSVDSLDLQVLTLEHVPPESVGGKEITLTCADCNSTAGAGPDAEMHRRRLVEDFLRGHGEEVVMKLKMGGHQVSVNVERDGPGGAMSVTARPTRTNPMAQAGWEEYLERTAQEGSDSWGFTLTMRGYDKRLAAVGDLRAAYLATFAKLGYSYILSPALEGVRAQLQKPKEKILNLVQGARPDAAPDAREMAVSDTPVRCLCVALGPRLIILPWPPSGVDPFEAIPKAGFAQGQRMSFQGGEVPWPIGMELVLDVRSQPA